jgi:plasmid stabilization system protein ParE
MRVPWNKSALIQLQAAHEWIKKENAVAAREFVEAVAALVDLLGEYPGMGVKTDEPGITMFPLVRYRYLIYYKTLKGGEIRIIRVRHASRRRPP